VEEAAHAASNLQEEEAEDKRENDDMPSALLFSVQLEEATKPQGGNDEGPGPASELVIKPTPELRVLAPQPRLPLQVTRRVKLGTGSKDRENVYYLMKDRENVYDLMKDRENVY
jgi:hypothetical protein